MKKNDTIVINMTQYGINTFVETTEKKINFYLNEYKTQPDKRFGGGVGKKALMAFTLESIQKEDIFFSKNLNAAITMPQRWDDFLEDCIIYATLHSYFNNIVPSTLLEPLTKGYIKEVIEDLIKNKYH
jgi:hypothetical protein